MPIPGVLDDGLGYGMSLCSMTKYTNRWSRYVPASRPDWHGFRVAAHFPRTDYKQVCMPRGARRGDDLPRHSRCAGGPVVSCRVTAVVIPNQPQRVPPSGLPIDRGILRSYDDSGRDLDQLAPANAFQSFFFAGTPPRRLSSWL